MRYAQQALHIVFPKDESLCLSHNMTRTHAEIKIKYTSEHQDKMMTRVKMKRHTQASTQWHIEESKINNKMKHQKWHVKKKRNPCSVQIQEAIVLKNCLLSRMLKRAGSSPGCPSACEAWSHSPSVRIMHQMWDSKSPELRWLPVPGRGGGEEIWCSCA